MHRKPCASNRRINGTFLSFSAGQRNPVEGQEHRHIVADQRPGPASDSCFSKLSLHILFKMSVCFYVVQNDIFYDFYDVRFDSFEENPISIPLLIIEGLRLDSVAPLNERRKALIVRCLENLGFGTKFVGFSS